MGKTGLKVVGTTYGILAAVCGAGAALLGKAIVEGIGILSLNSIAVCAVFTSVVACTALFSAAVARDCFTLAKVR
jgi:hypothetical protein